MIVAARRAVVADLDVVADLRRSFVEEMRPLRGGRIWAERDGPREPVGTYLGAAVDDPVNLVLVGVLDDVVVGYCMTRIETLSTGTRLGRLSELYVEPEAREVGVGEAMLGFVVGWCREHGCVGIDSVVLPGLRSSKNFFETAGFVARAIVVHHSLELGAE
ncbi:MAG: GNAT family N-acetyltransferase [Acidimicrobiia bacterium]